MKADVEQSSDEPRIASRSARISSHLHNDHGIGAARLDEELDFTENWPGDRTTLRWLRFAMRTMWCLIAVSVSAAENNGARSDRKTERVFRR